MEENNKPNVFPQGNTNNQPVPSEAELLMIKRREDEMKQRNIAKAVENPIKPVTDFKPTTPVVEPDYDSDFDLIPLPSKGKTYKNNKPNLKVSFLNASDENILTNPNLLKSGRFLEVLFGRKILDPTLDFRDLLVGDRNAIMIWLRATGYGNIYPIQVMDPETYEMFTTEIDLDELKTNTLELEPDEEGLFDFEFPMCKKKIKFKFLTVGDAEIIEARGDKFEDDSSGANFDLATFTLGRQIVEVEGNRDPEYISGFISKLRTMDARSFKKHLADNECGVDLNITVTAPGGGQVTTFFPLNPRFFWPEL